MAADKPVKEDGKKPAWRKTRWTLVAVLVLGVAATLLLVRPRVCSQQVSEGKVLDVCTAISVTDPRVVLVFLAVALLLLPDIQELDIAGVVKFTRAAEKASGAAKEAKSAAEKIAGAAKGAEAVAKEAGNVSRATRQMLSMPGIDGARGKLTLSTARVQRGVTSGEPPDADVLGGGPAGPEELARAEEALMAFKAGFLGLEQLFPDALEVRGLVGLVPDGTGWRRLIGTGDAPVDVEAWFRGYSSQEVTVEVLPEGLLGAAIVLDVMSAPVCALVAVCAPVADDGSPGRAEELAASVHPVSRAFRRLLADLLGEPTAAGI